MSNQYSLFTKAQVNTLRATHHEYTSHLTNKLITTFSIPSGAELVKQLGFGFEQNNKEALESWVYAVCTSLRLPFNYTSLPILESTLGSVLNALELQFSSCLVEGTNG